MYAAYEEYYRTSMYDQRYPRPNSYVLRRIRAIVPAGGTLVDVGAGNGRYAIPLAGLGYRVLAVERSSEARTQLAARVEAAGVGERVALFRDAEDIGLRDIATADAFLFLFGVLAHMASEERARLLHALSVEAKADSLLVGSVPNRYRRFRKEQRANKISELGVAPRFCYVRELGGRRHVFEYSAYSPHELREELGSHGWRALQMSPETIFTERVATNHPRIASIEARVLGYLPAAIGYCIYFELARSGTVAPPLPSLASSETA